MVGRKADDAEAWLAKYDRGELKTPTPENFRRTDGSIGDFVRFRFLRDLVDAELKDLCNEPLWLTPDFLSKGRSRLTKTQLTKIIGYFRPRIESRGFVLPDCYFDRQATRFYHLRLAVDRLHHADEFDHDLLGLPSSQTHILNEQRTQLLGRLRTFAESNDRRVFFLTGEEGRGKTVLISKFLHDAFPDNGLRPIYVDCRVEFTFARFVRRLCTALAASAGETSERDPISEQIVSIRRKLERSRIFLVMDNYELFSDSEEGGYHAIRADNFLDFALELANSNIDVKLLIASTLIPDRLSDSLGFSAENDSAQAPPIDPDEWLAGISDALSASPYNEQHALKDLVEALEGRDIPGPLYLLAWTALRYDASPSTVAELVIRMLRRSYRGVVKEVIKRMPPDHVVLFHLLALSEDGLKVTTLMRVADELGAIKSNFTATVQDFQALCRPIITELPQDGSVALEVNWRIRRAILKFWDARDPSMDLPFHQSVGVKRRAHRVIARLALNAASEKEAKYKSASDAAIIQQRYIQAYIHLLASLNPRSFRFLGLKRFSRVGRASALSKIIGQTEKDADCIEAAIYIWNVLQGHQTRIVESSGIAINLRGADDVKVDLLLRTFHIGYSYHATDLSNGQLRSRLHPDLDRIGIETGVLPGLNDLFSNVFKDLSYSAFRAHRTDLANCAIDRGKILIESIQTEHRLFYEEQYVRLMSVHLDILMRNGRLGDVEALAVDYKKLHFNGYLKQRIAKHRQDRTIIRKRKTTEQVGSRKSFEQLVFSAIGNIKLHAKLTEAYLMQGRLHRAAIETRACAKFFTTLRNDYQLRIAEFGAGNVLLSRPTEYRALRDLVRRNIFRIAARSLRMKTYCPGFLFSDDQIADAERTERIKENASALNWVKRAAERIWAQASRDQEFDQETLAGLDYLLWLRFKFDDGGGELTVQRKQALQHGAEKIVDGLWTGDVSPMNKIDALMERSRILWMLAQEDAENGWFHVDRAVKTL